MASLTNNFQDYFGWHFDLFARTDFLSYIRENRTASFPRHFAADAVALGHLASCRSVKKTRPVHLSNVINVRTDGARARVCTRKKHTDACTGVW